MLEVAPLHGARVQVIVSNKLPAWAYSLHADLDARSYADHGRAASFASSFAQHSVDCVATREIKLNYCAASAVVC